MGKVKNSRKFDGETYYYMGGGSTKENARKAAARIRAKGYKARVVQAPKTSVSKAHWLVWSPEKKTRKRR